MIIPFDTFRIMQPKLWRRSPHEMGRNVSNCLIALDNLFTFLIPSYRGSNPGKGWFLSLNKRRVIGFCKLNKTWGRADLTLTRWHTVTTKTMHELEYNGSMTYIPDNCLLYFWNGSHGHFFQRCWFFIIP